MRKQYTMGQLRAFHCRRVVIVVSELKINIAFCRFILKCVISILIIALRVNMILVIRFFLLGKLNFICTFCRLYVIWMRKLLTDSIVDVHVVSFNMEIVIGLPSEENMKFQQDRSLLPERSENRNSRLPEIHMFTYQRWRKYFPPSHGHPFFALFFKTTTKWQLQ